MTHNAGQPHIQLQHRDAFAGWVHLRRAGTTLAAAATVLADYRHAHPGNTYRLVTLDKHGNPVPETAPTEG